MTGKADAVKAVSREFKDRINAVIDGVMAHLRDDNANEILGPALSPLIGRGDLKSIVKFALYADVLRMVRDMVMADGEISDEEVQESLGLLSVLASAFVKVRKEYASFAELSSANARQFLVLYGADTGMFGYANEATKWASVKMCQNIKSQCNEPGPLETFGKSLLAGARAIAASDEMTASERHLLASLKSLTEESCQANEAADGVIFTRAIAEQILEDSDSVDLSKFTRVDEAALLCLSKDRPYLDLSGLKELSIASARALADYPGELGLGGLSTFSDDVALELARSVGSRNLSGIVQVSRRQADLFVNNPRLCFDGLVSIEGLPCEYEKNPAIFPAPDEIPLCAGLLGWATFRGLGVEGQPLRPKMTDLDSLAVNFPQHKPLFLAGWFTPLSPEELQRLAPYRGTLVLSPEALEGGALSTAHARAICALNAEVICFSFSCGESQLFEGLTPEVAAELLAFRGRFKGDPSLIIFGQQGFELLEQHRSINADGRWTGRVQVNANVVCRLCGDRNVLCEESAALGEIQQEWGHELRQKGWCEDSYWGWICESCRDVVTAAGGTVNDANGMTESVEDLDQENDDGSDDEGWDDDEWADPDEDDEDDE